MVKVSCLESRRLRVRAPPWPSSFKKTKCYFSAHSQRFNIVVCLCDREVACSASDRQGSNLESCVWRTVSSQSSHHPQEVLLAQFSLYVHKGGLKPDSFHLFLRGRGHGAVVKASCVESRRLRLRAPPWPSSFKKTKCYFSAHSQRFNIVVCLCNREVVYSASDRQGSNFEFCFWRAVSSHSSQHSHGDSPGPV